ncbi:hypothetical protein [Olleya sp. Bg11-27]|uniref:hypothetical protein n=1 Tax=Olleya sp. Bg11-27 TaxID=2058135 RepID=UPI000C30A537|nr:hypothetical protein [Olleya sp. Bg11-27]AUC76393.1 hypothetical protein CW732_12245 [Olleya sp. Bg11-27]
MMIKLKYVIAIVAIICCTTLYGQTTTPLHINQNVFKVLKFDFTATSYTLDYKSVGHIPNTYQFFAYNPMTALTDRYSVNNGNFIYNTSNLVLENNFRANKIDSFNPYGVSNIGSALIFGVFGKLFN